jgi:hypothetical protein
MDSNIIDSVIPILGFISAFSLEGNPIESLLFITLLRIVTDDRIIRVSLVLLLMS